MKYILDAEQMKKIDNFTSDSIGVPSEVLMERAALVCAEEIRASGFDTSRILIVCGNGNNGADGLALARIINRFYKPDVFVTDNYKNLTGLVKKQYDSAARSKVRFINEPVWGNYTLVVDAVFGTGLSRNIEGRLAEIIEKINNSNAKIVSVDIPSGIHATTGRALGCAVKADLTVSFAYTKLGQVLFPGAEHCGQLKVRDIGIYTDLCDGFKPAAYTYTERDLSLIPARKRYSNKGTYGRVLVIAGSENMSGAAILASTAAYKSGAGLVEVFTHEKIKTVLQGALPEAIVTSYSDGNVDFSALHASISSAASVVIGPGLSKSDTAKKILRYTLESSTVPTVIDADALNLIAEDKLLLNYIKGKIITPHLGEMSRLTGKSVSEIADSLIDTATHFARDNSCVCVLKDTRTVVSVGTAPVFINTAGNSGMAKGGSGDTLAGIIASLAAQGVEIPDAARLGVFLHASAGDNAAAEHGEYAMLAGDISEAVGKIMAGLKQ